MSVLLTIFQVMISILVFLTGFRTLTYGIDLAVKKYENEEEREKLHDQFLGGFITTGFFLFGLLLTF